MVQYWSNAGEQLEHNALLAIPRNDLGRGLAVRNKAERNMEVERTARLSTSARVLHHLGEFRV